MTVSVTSEQLLYIPNIFSPNGDGINDVLKWDGNRGVKEIALMEIFDRWGNLVFGFSHKTDDDPAGQWDGTLNGKQLNPGVFTYKAIVVYVTGETEVSYGDITLIR
jgi:gliding motility-associated-like protein